MEQPVFDHEGPWTEAAYLALNHDGRVEVIDGTLLVGPGAGPQRTRMIERVREAVAAALPAGLRVRGPVALRLGPDCVLMPDLVVTAAAPAAPVADAADEDTEASPEDEDAAAVLEAAAALMVIEVVGCDHGATDRMFKPQLYARSRIPYSLLIDHDGPFAVADMIIGGRYHEYARGSERLQLEEPFVLDLDLTTTAGEAAPAEERAETPAEAGA